MVRLIGPTLRLAVSFEEGAPESLDARPLILAFWHSCIFPAIYAWRDLQIRVMSSDSFDGEYTGRIIRKFGFVKVRGLEQQRCGPGVARHAKGNRAGRYRRIHD